MDDGVFQFDLLSWNIHGFVGLDFRHDVERIGEFIKGLSPDIVAFQEVDLRRRSATAPDILEYLRKIVGKYSHEAWSLTGLEGNFGQVLLSRYPLRDEKNHDISLPGREPRKLIDVLVETPGGGIRILATHLGFRPFENRHQVNQLKEILNPMSDVPTVIMGDFNQWVPGYSRNFLTSFSEPGYSHRTYPSVMPIFSHDRIISLQGIRILESFIPRGCWWLSDHLPVRAKLAIS